MMHHSGTKTYIPNTFLEYIGGMTKQDLSNYLSLSEDLILGFKSDGDYVSCYIENEYHLSSGFRLDTNIVRFLDLEKKINSLGNGVFYNCSMLEEVEMEGVTTVTSAGGNQVYFSGTKIEHLNFPNLITQNGNASAFQGIATLKTINVPLIGFTKQGGFQNCGILENVTMQTPTSLGSSSFRRDYLITSVDCSLLTVIPSNCFLDCYNLIDINNINNVVNIQGNAFKNCRSLSDIDFPKVETVSAGALSYMYQKEHFNFPELTTIQGSGGNTGTFYRTPIKSFVAPKVTSFTGTSLFGAYTYTIEQIYCPMLSSLGPDPSINYYHFSDVKFGCEITVSSVLSTNNNGSVDATLQYAIDNKGAIVTYV